MFLGNYIKEYLASGQPILDAEKYGLKITTPPLSAEESYWKIVICHHLTPAENRGNHNLYVSLIDKDGSDYRGAGAQVDWAWEGISQKELLTMRPLVLDKGMGEPGGNIPYYARQTIYAKVRGAKSEQVSGINSLHPDEPGGNTIGHHSFFVVWQWTETGEVEPPPVEDETETIKVLRETLTQVGAIVKDVAELQAKTTGLAIFLDTYLKESR